jgi:hypothetical protein
MKMSYKLVVLCMAALSSSTLAMASETFQTFNGAGGQGQFMPCVVTLPPANWHLLTKSYGGTISLLKNLTKDECEFAKARALHLPATQAEKDEHLRNTKQCGKATADGLTWTCELSTSGRVVVPGDIDTAECFE